MIEPRNSSALFSLFLDEISQIINVQNEQIRGEGVNLSDTTRRIEISLLPFNMIEIAVEDTFMITLSR